MGALLIALCVVAFLLAVVAFNPVVVTVDSRNRQVRVRWLMILEVSVPLPGTAGEKRFYVLHRRVPLLPSQFTTAPAREKEPARAASRKARPPRKRRAMGRFFMRCLGDSVIRKTMARQLSKLAKRIFGSVHLARAASDISLPDPALNGMLAGALAAFPMVRRSGIRVDFSGENSLFLELRFHPHRVFKAFLFFLPGLPYRAVFRQWRAFSTARPRQ